MKKIVSIIVPIYNSEKYLEECLSSIKNQKYKDFEIIMVDDGSTDNSKLICDKYVKEDSNKFKYFYKANSGVSSTRNFGIKQATGDYICFVDSDDILSPDYILDFIIELEKSSYKKDYIVCNLNKFQNMTDVIYDNEKSEIIEYKSSNKYSIIFEECHAFVANRIFNRDIINSNNIVFDENIYMCEDLLFNYQYIKCCNDITYIRKINYFYRIYNSNSKKTGNIKWFSIFKPLSIISDDYEIFDFNTQKKFIYFFKTTLVEAKVRREENKNIKKSKEEEKIELFVKNKKMIFKDKVKYLIIASFPKTIIEYRNKKVS